MKIYFDTIGCRLNQAEIESIASQFRDAGHTIIENPEEADLVIVNTCTVTSKAAADSRKKIRKAGRNNNAQIIATGCWATMEPDQAAKLPKVTHIVPNNQKDQIALEVLSTQASGSGSAAQLSQEIFDLEPGARQPLPGASMRTRAFIKVQDGCNNHCTYCITRLARGRSHSREINEILSDIHRAQLGDAKEVVLTGVHLASWGQDFVEPMHLRQLIETILENTDLPRLRLSSLEAWDLDEDFFTLWQEPRLCPHLHLPLQSGAEKTLKHMARSITPKRYANMVDFARKYSPDIAITTDIIVGFPGETVTDHEESLAFVRQMDFAGGHVFNFSPRRGTPAAEYSDQVSQVIRKQRSLEMRSNFQTAAKRYRQRFIGTTSTVLWEKADLCKTITSDFPSKYWQMSGFTGNYLRVNALSPHKLWNELSAVLLEEESDHGLSGKIVQT